MRESGISHGGFHFIQRSQIGLWVDHIQNHFPIKYYKYICKVTVPDDARVCIEKNRFKCDILNIELDHKVCIADLDEWSDPEFCVSSIKQNPMLLRYIKNQTDELCLSAVTMHGDALYFVKNKTDKICMTAVKNKGSLLKIVENQTSEICLTAAKKDAYALRYIKNLELRENIKRTLDM
jgi:hypothetical protein